MALEPALGLHRLGLPAFFRGPRPGAAGTVAAGFAFPVPDLGAPVFVLRPAGLALHPGDHPPDLIKDDMGQGQAAARTERIDILTYHGHKHPSQS